MSDRIDRCDMMRIFEFGVVNAPIILPGINTVDQDEEHDPKEIDFYSTLDMRRRQLRSRVLAEYPQLDISGWGYSELATAIENLTSQS